MPDEGLRAGTVQRHAHRAAPRGPDAQHERHDRLGSRAAPRTAGASAQPPGAIGDPNSAEARQELTKALARGPSILVERAAKIIADAEVEGFEAPLKAAFERLLEGGAELDAGCGGKIVVATLAKLGLPANDVFLKAIHHVQHEYKEDTAAALRARAIVALAESGYGGMLEEAVQLLLDPELGARLGAVRALVADGSPAAMLLLRLEALKGDPDAEILHECLVGLIEREPSSLDFVASFFSRGWVGPASMALAGSRRPEVFKLLKAALHETDERDSQALMLAMGMLRSDESLDFLRHPATVAMHEGCRALCAQSPSQPPKLAR